MKHEVYRDQKLHVAVRKCATCIYRPGNLMHLSSGRKEQMEADSVEMGGVITCHKTISGEKIGPAVCRGYFDTQKRNVFLLTLAERMEILKEVDVDEPSPAV